MSVWDRWDPGFSQDTLLRASDRLGFRFPPDLIAFLRRHRIPGGYDWSGDVDVIQRAMDWPLKGILIDVEHNDIWWKEWGPRPDAQNDREQIVRAVVAKAPKLIPLLAHRYLPAEPAESGNPVLSILQMDIIYYGSDLLNYLENEFSEPHLVVLSAPIKQVPFWSTAVDRNYGPDAKWSNGTETSTDG